MPAESCDGVSTVESLHHCSMSACSTSRAFHLSFVLTASNQSLSRPATLRTGIGRDTVMETLHPRSSFPISRPSTTTSALPIRAFDGSTISTTLISLMSKGRKESDAGAMGVSKVHGTLGDTIGPPQLRLYPVEPVGEDIIMPSPSTSVTKVPSTKTCSLPIAEP